MPDLQYADLILARLSNGRDHPITYAQLTDQLGCSRRAVEKGVQELRARGWPICTTGSGDHRGAWLASDSSEVFGMYRALRRRALGQLVTARHVLRAAQRLERVERAQMTLGF